jgi:hypothetical protein
MRAKPHLSCPEAAGLCRVRIASRAEFELTHLFGPSRTTMFMRSRECPNQSLRVDVPTMRYPRCTPELVAASDTGARTSAARQR